MVEAGYGLVDLMDERLALIILMWATLLGLAAFTGNFLTVLLVTGATSVLCLVCALFLTGDGS